MKHCEKTLHSLGQLQSNDPFGFSFDTLSPKLEFGVDGAVEDEVPSQTLCMEGTDWRMMGYLLRNQPETLVLSGGGSGESYCYLNWALYVLSECVCVCVCVYLVSS